MAELARQWAAVVSRTTYLPISGKEVEQLLARLINRLVTAVATQVDEQAAIEVAAELVTHDLIGLSSISRSIEILGNGLPRLAELQHVDGRDAAVLRVLGALAGGYAEARRQRTLDEQDQVMQALLRAKLDAQRELRVSEARFRQIFSEAPVGIAISDLDGTLIAVNRAFAGIVGRASEDLIGAALPELLHAEDDPTLGAAYRGLISGKATQFRCRGQLTGDSGEVAWAFLAGSLLRDPEGVPTHHIITAEDITELQLLQQVLAEQALHDRLTGLPNEHYFMSHLQDVLEGADPSSMVTVCRINLDSFSVINDGIGRKAGELLLCSVAARLQELVTGKRAMVARMGTDDFAILIKDGIDSRDLSQFASTINSRLREPIYLDNQGIAISAGVGLVHWRAGGVSAAELIRAADATLHRAKRSGSGQWSLYDAQADVLERECYRWAAEISGAWENGEITLRYQPVCRLDSGRIVAIQASLRWDRTDGIVMNHAKCLLLAQYTGLLGPLGRWMVQQSCCMQQIQRSNFRGSGAPLLRVDLTAQLSQDPDLVAVVNNALSAAGLRAEQLRVGVPLFALASGRGDVVDNVRVLAALGAEVVLLGATTALAGYLGYLEELPVGAVEIAPDTVALVAQRPAADSLVARAVSQAIPLMHRAGATVIVPDVNTAEQAQWWRNAGADTAWGDHFGPPVPDSELPTLLANL